MTAIDMPAPLHRRLPGLRLWLKTLLKPRNRASRPLSELDARQLDDIGLTRADLRSPGRDAADRLYRRFLGQR